MKKLIGLIFLVLMLFSCDKEKVVKNEELVDNNIDVKVEEKIEKNDIEIKELKKVVEEKTITSNILNKNIFGDIEVYHQKGEINFRIYGELNAYIDKIEVLWFNNGIKRNTFFIDEKGAFEPEGYFGKKEGYTGFRYKFSSKNIDLGKNKYIFNAYLDNKIIDKSEFLFDTKVCLNNEKKISEVYDMSKNINIETIHIFDDNYFFTIIEKLNNDNVTLTLERKSCDLGNKEIIFQNTGSEMIRGLGDFIKHDIVIKGYYNKKLLFGHEGSNKGGFYLYDNNIGKLIKLKYTLGIFDLKKTEKGIIYISHSIGENSKLLLLNNFNEEIILYEDNNSNMGLYDNISEGLFILKSFKLSKEGNIKLSLLKGNDSNAPEMVEKTIDLDIY